MELDKSTETPSTPNPEIAAEILALGQETIPEAFAQILSYPEFEPFTQKVISHLKTGKTECLSAPNLLMKTDTSNSVVNEIEDPRAFSIAYGGTIYPESFAPKLLLDFIHLIKSLRNDAFTNEMAEEYKLSLDILLSLLNRTHGRATPVEQPSTMHKMGLLLLKELEFKKEEFDILWAYLETKESSSQEIGVAQRKLDEAQIALDLVKRTHLGYMEMAIAHLRQDFARLKLGRGFAKIDARERDRRYVEGRTDPRTGRNKVGGILD